MRELKFRAWDKKRKCMQDFSNCKDGILFCQDMMEVSSGYDGYSNPTFDETEPNRYILMQFTGLKDKDGKELDWWENDLIADGDNIKQIIYEDGCFWLQWTKHTDHKTALFACKEWADSLTKVGNIHDNRNLLDEG